VEEEKKEEVKDDKVELKPLVKHVLSAELQMYYEKVIEVIKKEKRDSLLRSLSTDAGIQQLVSNFFLKIDSILFSIYFSRSNREFKKIRLFDSFDGNDLFFNFESKFTSGIICRKKKISLIIV
jgi:hypothetical protein